MAGLSKKIGLFGGSFDPVHLGHLILAQDLIEFCAFDRLYLIPARHAPLREGGPEASAEQRLELLQLATADQDRIGVLDLELERPGISYTVDTVRRLRERWPEENLYWIIGADQLQKLAQWKSIEALGGLCEFLVLSRPGYAPEPPAALPASVSWRLVNQRALEISSSEIRCRLREGRVVDHLLPVPVARRIAELKLYQNLNLNTHQSTAYGSSS